MTISANTRRNSGEPAALLRNFTRA